MPGFDLKQINRIDQGILGAGALFFIASFLPFYGYSYHATGIHVSASVNAWHSWGVLGLLLVFIATIIVAARVFANASLPKLPVGVNLLVVGLAGLGTLLLILRAISYPSASGFGGSYGVKWGGIVLFIFGAAETAFAFLNFKASGEKVAWDATALPKSAPTGTALVPPAAPYGNAVAYPPAAPYGSAPAAPYGSAPAAPYEAPVQYPPAESTPPATGEGPIAG
jgi:hypothetical protein